MSCPSIVTRPLSASIILSRESPSVDLPAPVRPTTPTLEPALISNYKFLKTNSVFGRYLKLKLSNLIWPSAIFYSLAVPISTSCTTFCKSTSFWTFLILVSTLCWTWKNSWVKSVIQFVLWIMKMRMMGSTWLRQCTQIKIISRCAGAFEHVIMKNRRWICANRLFTTHSSSCEIPLNTSSCS